MDAVLEIEGQATPARGGSKAGGGNPRLMNTSPATPHGNKSVAVGRNWAQGSGWERLGKDVRVHIGESHVIWIDFALVGEHDGPLYTVDEFPHVAWPVVAKHGRPGRL